MNRINGHKPRGGPETPVFGNLTAGLYKKTGFGLFFWVLRGMFFLSLVFSCDLLRLSPFEVIQWTPGTGRHGDPGDITVSISFSHDPDKIAVEQAFSLTEDDTVLTGSFIWEGRTLVFKPALPLELNRSYVLTILEDARDRAGVSMDKKFEAPFSTRGAGKRPSVLSTDPPDMGVITDPRREIRIEFSEPVKVNSCVNAVSFSPSARGSWRLEAGDRRAVFVPREPWVRGTTYRIRFSPDFSGTLGLTLGKEWTGYFIVGNDKTPPVLEATYALDPEGNRALKLLPEEPGPLKRENAGWESSYRLALDFSEPVDTADLKNRLTVEPALAFETETPPGYAAGAVFTFTQNPTYSASYLFRLNAGVRDAEGNESPDPTVFRIRVDGPASRPPRFIGFRMPMAPGDPADEEAAAFSVEEPFRDLPVRPGETRYPYDVSTPAWIELYFDVVPGAGIDLFSLMNLFRVDAANNALSFSPRSMEAENFPIPDKPPAWEAYFRIKVKGVLTNTTDSGVVIFQIASGLQDSLGNRNEGAFKIPLLK
ncbi:MAG: Ig-like domain-containing protein [Spirochaetaceae bacterium]|jgi:hypothetical protein|nr:Ig-like domain-containing protein [Spirochaetaceae bacterium]